MKIRSEKGFTITDIAISIVVLFIFISSIAILSYNFNSYSKEIELKSQATELAIQNIESMKGKTIDELNTENTSYRGLQELENNEGFYRQITVTDYADINANKERDVIKKITVKIQYKFKKQIENVELSTLISKEI